MPDVQSTRTKIQWKWVWTLLLMYVALYFLPLSLVPGGFLSRTIVTKGSATLTGIWSLAGMFIIAAVAGFVSRGVTMKEPAVVALGVAGIWLLALQITFNRVIRFSSEHTLGLFIALLMIVTLAVGGAWFGERMQILQRRAKIPVV